jgi:hypothetical protein
LFILPRRQITLISSLILGVGVSIVVLGLLLHWQYGSMLGNLENLFSGRLFATFNHDVVFYAMLGLAGGILVVLAGLAMDAYQKRRGLFLEAIRSERALRLPRRDFEAPFSAIEMIEWIEVDTNERLSDARRETFARAIQVNIVHGIQPNLHRVNLITLSPEAAQDDDVRNAVEKLAKMIGVRVMEDLVIVPEPDYRAWKRSGFYSKIG